MGGYRGQPRSEADADGTDPPPWLSSFFFSPPPCNDSTLLFIFSLLCGKLSFAKLVQYIVVEHLYIHIYIYWLIFIFIWLVGAEKATTPTTPRKNESPMTPRKSEDGEKKAVSSNSGSSTPTKEDLSLKGKLPAATAASGAPFIRPPNSGSSHFDSDRFLAFALLWPWVVVFSGISAGRAAVAIGRVALAVVAPRRHPRHLPLPRERRHPPAPVRFRSSSFFPHSLSSFFFVLRCIQSWLA
jgi:hypothetical protein